MLAAGRDGEGGLRAEGGGDSGTDAVFIYLFVYLFVYVFVSFIYHLFPICFRWRFIERLFFSFFLLRVVLTVLYLLWILVCSVNEKGFAIFRKRLCYIKRSILPLK